MFRIRRSRWLSAGLFCLVSLGLVAYPAHSLYAQEPDDGAELRRSTVVMEDAAYLEQEEQREPAPFVEKPGALGAADDAKPSEDFAYSLFVPAMSSGSEADAAAVNAPIWRNIILETFEGSFPNGNWLVGDYNGATVGGYFVWDDAVGGYNSNWAAHPTGNTDTGTYNSNVHTWMRYGPFSLVGAQNARVLFKYWLSSEQYYDFFSWEYSCNGPATWHGGESRSGGVSQWLNVTMALSKCIGETTVYVRFHFRSDYSGHGQGVWVDAVQIQKYQ